MIAAGTVRAFDGQLITARWAARVVSPLHDVLTPGERRAVLASNPDSYLHVTSDPQDLPDSGSARSRGIANAVALQRLLDLGAYGAIAPERLFVYSMTDGSGHHTGIVAAVDVAGFRDGRVLGHEGVQPERVDGLVRHFDVVHQRSELVSLMHRDDREVAAIVTRIRTSAPCLELVDFSGVEHRVWEVDRQDRATLARRLSGLQLYIADGHHRVAASVRRWERDGHPAAAAVLCAIYPEDEIRLFAFHRRVCGPVDVATLLARIAERFELSPASGPAQEVGSVGLYAAGTWRRLRLFGAGRSPGVAGLDVSVLQEQILDPLLGVGTSYGDPRLEFVPELQDLQDSITRCDADGGVLFTVQAPGVEDLVTVAERGEVMTPKSTFVQPKPRTGIFLSKDSEEELQ